MKKTIQLITGTLCVLLLGTVAALGQDGDGHDQNLILDYTPSGFSVNTYMLQQSDYTSTAKNTINNEGGDAVLFVNYTFNTSGKSVYIVYTTDGSAPTKSNGSVVSMSFSNYTAPNSTFVGNIPSSANQEGNTVNYVFYISDSDLASAWGRAAGETGHTTSWTEGDDYYSYDVYSASAGTGNFSSTGTWEAGSVPTSKPVEILDSHTITLDSDYSVKKLSILNGGTFTASDGSARTLTISNSASGDQTSFTNNGTWNNGTGSTVVFTGAPSSGDVQHDIAGSSSTAFQNVTVKKTGGSDNVGADFQSNTSVDGTLRIGAGGYIATAPPTDFYGGNAILDFNQGSGAEYVVGSEDYTWSTTEVPNNITITTGTVKLNEARTLTGELLIETDATLVTNGNFNLATGGVLNNSGTITGDINFLRELTGAEGFRLLSSPVASTYDDLLDNIWTQGQTDAGANGGDTNEGDSNIYTWSTTSTDGDSTNWSPLTDLSGTVTAGTGLLAYVFDDNDYSGSADESMPTLSVTGSENGDISGMSLNQNNDGWTLVGNPFASTIDFDNVTFTELTDVAYVWDPAGSQWLSHSQQAGLGNLSGGLIASFQGFFVQNDANVESTSTITILSSAKSETNGSFYGKTANEEIAKLRLQFEGNELSNSIWIHFSENGSSSQKVKGDAMKLEPLSSEFVQVALQKESTLYDIAHLPFTESEYALPLSMKATAGGTYTLKATDFEIPSNMELIFHDYETGISESITSDFSVEVELPAAKVQNVPTLKRIQQAPVLAKGSDTNRYGISVRSKSATSNEPTDAPESFTLEQNYPNPFNPTTSIQYSVAEAGDVSLTVYNVMGQRVETLVSGTKAAGTYRVSWDAANMASGIYYYRLHAAGQVLTRQMTLIK